MKKFIGLWVLFTVIIGFGPVANGEMILDEGIILSYRWSTIDSIKQEIALPSGGGRGSFSFFGGEYRINFDVSPERFLFNFDFPGPALFASGIGGFVGLAAEGINPDEVEGIATNLPGWDSSRIIRGPNFLAFNLNGLVAGLNEQKNTFNVLPAGLKPGVTPPPDPPASAVPEPATMLLLCSGILGLAGLRRKLKK